MTLHERYNYLLPSRTLTRESSRPETSNARQRNMEFLDLKPYKGGIIKKIKPPSTESPNHGEILFLLSLSKKNVVPMALNLTGWFFLQKFRAYGNLVNNLHFLSWRASETSGRPSVPINLKEWA